MRFIVAADTDIGLSKSSNQDSFGARSFMTSQGPMVFAVLCDGMGGLSKGEVASGSVVKAFLDWADHKLPLLLKNGKALADKVIRSEWNEIIQSFNRKIMQYGRAHQIQLGTTLAVSLLTQERCFLAHVGDSRIYELSTGIRRMTEDHSLVQREINLGHMSEEEAERDPRRSVLLQCIGVLETVEPGFCFGDVRQNACYLLCSDGFRHQVTETEIYRELQPSRLNSQEEIEQNIRRLIDLNKERKERDNISALLIRTF